MLIVPNRSVILREIERDKTLKIDLNLERHGRKPPPCLF